MASLDDRSTFDCKIVLEEDSNFVPISLDDDGKMWETKNSPETAEISKQTRGM